MTDRPSGVPEATAGAVDLLINREHALARERELEAEIERLRQMYSIEMEQKRLFSAWQEHDAAELRSLREQNATLRAEVERLTKGGAE